MNWKNKIKTVVIAGVTMLTTSCGFGGGKKASPIERPQGVEAKGNVQDALFENTGNGDNISEAQLAAIVNGQKGQDFSDGFRADLANSGIYMSKKGEDGKTEVLVSVDKLSHEENGRIVTEYQNPKYGPNEIKSNIEIKNGMEVRHPEEMVFEADTLTPGINKVSEEEYVVKEAEIARRLSIAQEKLKGMNEGDTVSVAGIKAVIGKNGNQLDVKAKEKVKVTSRKRTLTLDYVRGKKIGKEPE